MQKPTADFKLFPEQDSPATVPPSQPSAQPNRPTAPAGRPGLHVAPPAETYSARFRRRHRFAALTFLFGVIVPFLVTAWYLAVNATPQYASSVGFSVQREEISSPLEILGGVTGISGSSTRDTDILYAFIQGQELVQRIDSRLALRVLWSRPHGSDPVFAFAPDGSIEDLVDYWSRMVRISYDSGTGLIDLRVLAFDPHEAQAIAQAIFDESSTMINGLSTTAREDATRYAREELGHAVERLKQAREALTDYRSRTRIVDPVADVQGQLGLLNTLQQQLGEALVDYDLLLETTQAGDPRLVQVERRVEVIRSRIAEEREKFGIGGDAAGTDYASLFAEFERLNVDREFAEQAYTAALATYDAAQAEARRQSRYLAAYIRPTLAETSQYPQKGLILGVTLLFLALSWSILLLIYYSVRDRR